MPAWLLVACMALATWRATRLVTEDDFPPVRWARNRLVDKGPEFLGDLVTCPWCASVWLAAFVVAATDAFSSIPRPLLAFGAVAALSPILATLVTRWERQSAMWGQYHEEPEQEPEAEDEMATMVTLERQDAPNGRVDA